MKKDTLLFYSITALGISSVITQIVLIREFLSVFHGNELVLGIILANWLLLTGIGAYLGKFSDNIKNKINFIVICQILIALIPFIYLFLIRNLRNLFFPTGSMISITSIFLSSFLVLVPYCLISGFLLTLFCSVFSIKGYSAIGKVYFIDNIGDILGGFLFSFVLIFFLNPFQMIFFIMITNFAVAFFLANYSKSSLLKYAVAVLILLSFIILVIDFNRITTEMQYPNQEVIFKKNSIYGDLVITRTLDQLNFYENGVVLFSTNNTITREETVHYALSQHKNPEHVLLISGGISGTAEEILKHQVKQIDYVELDPLIIEIGRTFSQLNPRINIITKDARLYLRDTSEKYDAVIIDLPDPSTAQINRFYTIEFFRELNGHLNNNAVVSLSLSSTANYLNKESIQLHSILFNTLKEVFNNVIIVPGERNYFIASNNALNFDVAENLAQKNITNSYVNEFYLGGILTEDRIDYVANSIKKTKINKDFAPVSYYYQLLFWLSYFKANYFIFIGIIAVLAILFLIHIKLIHFAIFTTGFAASSLEIILLISFQIIYGCVYHMLGILITMFMLGLALGSYYMNKHTNKTMKCFISLEFTIAIYAFALPFLLLALSKIHLGFILSQIIFAILTLIISIIAGMEFPLASKLSFKRISKTAAQLYNADLVGAAIGALLVSVLLIPVLGIVAVCIIVGILNLISAIILLITRKPSV